ncbi:MAG: Nif3-like dinuclear metal center hexameric protein [Paludibacteraceae bacterium]|nr:Nif3-like dinuclear metal center hexameric protein [Paludibacteraceae bacterium]
MKASELCNIIEKYAPLRYQESYDNCGLQIGDASQEVSGVLITMDVTEEVVEEAAKKGCNFILAHHPLIFRGLKKLTGGDYVQRCAIKAIKKDICIYACHTNADKIHGGVSFKLAEKLGLANCKVLAPEYENLLKLVTFVPAAHTEKVLDALHAAGAGTCGNYDRCSFRHEGTGAFRANEGCSPFVGNKGEIHEERENRIEMILRPELKSGVISALLKSHPYEEPAFDLIELDNRFCAGGLGVVGDLPEPVKSETFLSKLKETLGSVIRHTELTTPTISRVALCGGSGAEFLPNAIKERADIFISADFKYHQFFDAEKRIIIADAGHFETEQFIKESFFELISKNSANFAIHLTEYKTNPIKYL